MVCIGTLIFVLALFILFHQNATATKGYELRGLERERTMLLLEQEVLNMEIAEAQSLQHLQHEEQIQRMSVVSKPRYVKTVLPMVTRQTSSATSSSGSRP